MQNTPPAGSETARDDPLAQSEDSLSYEAPQPTSSQPISENRAHIASERKIRTRDLLRAVLLGVLLLVLGAGAFVFLRRGDSGSQIQAGAFNEIRLPLSGVLSSDVNGSTQSLQVNGRLQVNSSVVLAPTPQPDNPLTGQLYFDQDTSRLVYYDGAQFINLQGGTSADFITSNAITNVTNNLGGVDLNGTPGSIAMFTGVATLGSSLINQSGSTLNIATSGGTQINLGGGSSAVTIEGSGGIQIGNAAGNHAVQIGTGAGVQNVSLGSAQASSATTIQAGIGNLVLSTGSATGITGSISITTGDSSTTASGNITIDAGEGIVDGEVIEDKTFEGGLDSMTNWFGSTVAQSSTQAHTGTHSLAATTTNAFWGVIELLPGTSVTAGHQYFFSMWVRADSAPRTINANVVWEGSGGQIVTFTPVVDSATGWTQMTALGAAPPTATSVYFRVSSSGATVGEIHYFDDITVTDLSSAAAISSISIGADKAKVVTIGNLNQIGATSIYGSSGISLNSGAAGVTLNGGVIGITGNAASSLSTTSGALTITSATSATWGVGTASAGVGGDLTLRAGRGGTDANNNGGDLILQGGNPNGTGIPGGVVVRPQTDTTDTFQIQSSASTPLLTADTTALTIRIGGTDAAFATLALANAHFVSTQTTPPTIGTPTNCGTTPIATMTTGSTDSAGSFTVTTGTGGTSSTCDTTITFHQTYGSAPKSIIVVGKTNAASVQRQVFISVATATTFTVSFANSAGGADNTPYEFSYWVIK